MTIADPNVAVVAALKLNVADMLPAGIVMLPAGVWVTPCGKPVMFTVMGAVVVPFHPTLICTVVDVPVWIVVVSGLTVRLKSAAGVVGVLGVDPAELLAPPPHPV
jgi:hypothetical protein